MQAVSDPTILVVDDDAQMRSALSEAIGRMGYTAVVCGTADEAIRKLSGGLFALVVTDMRMPKMDGLTFIREARRRNGTVPFLVITGFGTVENAVECMKEGAVDYLMKPFSFDALKRAVENVLARSAQAKDLVATDPAMQKVVALARNLGSSDITVLITGESGTGKELLAREIHRLSRRADKPFVAVNCAAIPDTLLESELFGHEKGAFTGAVERKIGKFELADGGTILLDEISEMPMLLQAKLLRVLQEREVDRVGGRKPVPVDVRVIATTNRDMALECREGRFREDLYYRLNVFPLRVPPLRERPQDIAVLARHFAGLYAARAGKSVTGLSERALEALRRREWRGNVRELENAIQRAVFVCRGSEVDADDLVFDDGSMAPQAHSAGGNGNGRLKDMEKELILKTLKEVNNNKTQAARILGVSVRTIRNKLAEYGQNVPGA